MPPRAGRRVRLHDRLGPADHLERVVGADAAGELLHLRDRVAGAGVDEVGGAERLGGLALHLHRVDREDPARAGDARALDDGLADAAAADDRDGRARRDLRGVERRAHAGGDAAADERELLVGEVGVDLHDVRLVARHLVGEGAEAGHAVRDAAVGARRLRAASSPRRSSSRGCSGRAGTRSSCRTRG